MFDMVMSSGAYCRSGCSGLVFGIVISSGSWGFLGRVSSSSVSMLVGNEVADWEILEMDIGMEGVLGLSEGEGAL